MLRLFAGRQYAGRQFTGHEFQGGVNTGPVILPDGGFIVRETPNRTATDPEQMRKRVSQNAPKHRIRRARFRRRTSAMDTIYKKVGERKTVGFDFTPEGALIGGDVLDSVVSVLADSEDVTLTALTLGTPAINVAKFYDTDGQSIPIGKGVAVRVTGGSVGEYTLRCLCNTLSGDRLGVNCRLIVKE